MHLKMVKTFSVGLILFVIYSSAIAQDKLIISTGANAPVTRIAENILKQAYHSLGIEVVIAKYPDLRSLISSNAGLADGELMRIRGIDTEYPNLLIVPIPLLQLKGVAYTKDVDLQIVGFESLKPYRVAIQRGIKFAEYGTDGMKRTILNTLEHAFFLLHKKRVDAVITTYIEGIETLNRLQYEGIKALEPPLITINLYHYLHKRNRALVPKITAALQEMQENGRISKERERYVNELFKNTSADQAE